MPELTSRPYQSTDDVAVTDFVNGLLVAGGGRAGLDVGEVVSFITAIVADVANNSEIQVDQSGQIVAVSLVGPPPLGGHLVELDGGVRPDHRGRGLGRALLGRQLDRATELYRQASDAGLVTVDRPWQVQVSVPVGDHDTARLVARFGLEPVRYWFEMVAPTAGAPEPTVPTGLRGVPFAAEYGERLYAAHLEAFADHYGFQGGRGFDVWAAVTIGLESFEADLSRIVFDGDEIAGYLLAYRDPEPGRLYIGQVGTRRPWRRRGLAGALLADVLRAASAVGFDQAGLGVDADSPTGAVGVYEKVGFVVEERSVTYARDLDGAGAADDVR